MHNASIFPFVLLGVALLIALGFEFVNGFHDTANAVATCIYTHSLEPHIAVVYSGIMNFIGVLTEFRRGGVQRDYAAAGGIDSEGEQGLRLRDGVCAADRGDHLEPGDVVAGAAGVELAHDDRVHHWRGDHEPVDAGQQRARLAWNGRR